MATKYRRQQYDEIDVLMLKMEMIEKRLDMLERLMVSQSGPTRQNQGTSSDNNVRALMEDISHKLNSLCVPPTQSDEERGPGYPEDDEMHEPPIKTDYQDPKGISRRRTLI
jgi:hypothetical protein